MDMDYPWKWAVCDYCRGNGTSSAYLGAFTQSEWYEQDVEFRENYMAGMYDRPCPECDGRTTVKVADTDRMTEEQLAEYESELRADAMYRAEVQAERRAFGDY